MTNTNKPKKSHWREKLAIAGALTLPIGGDQHMRTLPPRPSAAELAAHALPDTLSKLQYDDLLKNCADEIMTASKDLEHSFGLLDALTCSSVEAELIPSHEARSASLTITKGTTKIRMPWMAQLMDLAITDKRELAGRDSPITAVKMLNDLGRHFDVDHLQFPKEVTDHKVEIIQNLQNMFDKARILLSAPKRAIHEVPLLNLGRFGAPGLIEAECTFTITDPRGQEQGVSR